MPERNQLTGTAPLVGVNLPWLRGGYGHDLGVNLAFPSWPVVYDRRAAADLINLLSTFGVRTIRFWLFEHGEGIVYDEHKSITGVDDTLLENLSSFVDVLRSAQVRVFWTLLDANSVLRSDDQITSVVLRDPDQARRFCDLVLAKVYPIISPITWAVDVCNEPEAFVTGEYGNGTTRGEAWRTVLPAIAVLHSESKNLFGPTPVSIGSGYQEFRTLAAKAYGAIHGQLDFFDYHTYLPTGIAPVEHIGLDNKLRKPWVLGEIGSEISSERRHLPQAWEESQRHLVNKLHSLTHTTYAAGFLWYVSDTNAHDASSLFFGGKPGPALHNLRLLAEAGLIRTEGELIL